jgi:hypothetical protein
MSTSTAKVFSADEATRMLPLVRRIVADIIQAGNVMKTMARETMTGDHAARLEVHIASLKQFIKELEDLGCSYRDWDFKTGIVDFPAEVEGRPALLSWRSDEATVHHFYYADETPENRRALPSG